MLTKLRVYEFMLVEVTINEFMLAGSHIISQDDQVELRVVYLLRSQVRTVFPAAA